MSTEPRQNLSRLDYQYGLCLENILNETPSKNLRTKKKVKALHGQTFKVGPGQIPLLGLRDIKPLWDCAEVVWFMSGRKDLKFMQQFGFKAWDKFSEDGKTVDSATGWRWRHTFRVDQLRIVMDKLLYNPTDRQCVLVSWDPRVDLNRPGLNVPCLVTWHFTAIGRKLNLTVLQRSADMYFGFPHDIFGSYLLLELVAAWCGLSVGDVCYTVSNAHLYEDQWENAAVMVERFYSSVTERKPELFDWSDTQTTPINMGLDRQDAAHAMSGEPELVGRLYGLVTEFYRPWPPLSGPELVS